MPRLRLVLCAAAWLAGSRLLATQGALLLPRAVARELSLDAYLAIVSLVSTVAGLGLAFAVLPDARRALGLRSPGVPALGRVVLASPLVLVGASYLGVFIALPTLRAELLQGGMQAVQENAGALGRALAEPPLVVTLLWTAALAPVAEELLFRGALWSALTALTEPRGEAAPRSLPSELLAEGLALRVPRAVWAWLRRGGLATLGAAALFGGLHAADARGGTGIVRVVSALVLGLACGLARQASGVLAAIALHACFNLLGVLQLRGLAHGATFPKHYGVATFYSLLAGACALALGAWLGAGVVGARRRRRQSPSAPSAARDGSAGTT